MRITTGCRDQEGRAGARDEDLWVSWAAGQKTRWRTNHWPPPARPHPRHSQPPHHHHHHHHHQYPLPAHSRCQHHPGLDPRPLLGLGHGDYPLLLVHSPSTGGTSHWKRNKQTHTGTQRSTSNPPKGNVTGRATTLRRTSCTPTRAHAEQTTNTRATRAAPGSRRPVATEGPRVVSWPMGTT